MPEPSKDGIGELLARLGLSGHHIHNVKLGPGVVGRNSSIAYALEGVAFVGVFAGWRLQSPLLALMSVGGGILVAMAIPVLNVYFGNKNPAAALLEGAQFLEYQHMQMAAKGIPVIEATPAIPAPSTLPSADTKSLGEGVSLE